MLSAVLLRLFYWQVWRSDFLSAQAQAQRIQVEEVDVGRGAIYASDGFVLTNNQDQYLLYAYTPQLEQEISQISQVLAPVVLPEPKDATEAAKPHQERVMSQRLEIEETLSQPDKKWIPIIRDLNLDQKEAVEALDITGLGFDVYQRRHYPEASMAAHLLGFVGHDDLGQRTGYFGLEGKYNRELEGKSGRVIQEIDAAGQPLLMGLFQQQDSRFGRDLHLHLDRKIQHLVEQKLDQALEQYGAISGEIIVMDPDTGGIIANAALPSYDPNNLGEYSAETYKNPSIANTYEPGSTFKVVVMAAGIEAGVITPQTRCDSTCDGPVKIDKYSIQTWNNTYHPGSTMTEVLENSDNTGMIFVANKLGKDKFVQAIKDFGFGEKTGIDLQEEASAGLRDRWSQVDVATASFGQGLVVTGIQMVQAVAAIANGGELVTPKVVSSVVDQGREIEIKPKIKRRVISQATADQVTRMMESAAHNGESQWAVLRNWRVAGKTGTAQVAVDGEYDESKTIVSFIGFAPVDDPKFVMLVKLQEPSSSPWAAETAAPLWYSIAQDILLTYNIAPSQ